MSSFASPVDNSFTFFHQPTNFMDAKRSYFTVQPTPLVGGAENDEMQVATPLASQRSHNNTTPKLKSMNISDRSYKITGWKSHPLRIIYLVSKFLQMLKTSTDLYKFKLITKKIMTVLNDQTTDFSFYQTNGLIHDKPSRARVIWRTINQHIDFKYQFNIKVFQPDNKIRVVFDAVVLAVILINLFYIPMKICFSLDGFFSKIQSLIILDLLPCFIFIIEILVKFNTAFYEDGIIHESHKEIARNYLKNDMINDFIFITTYFLSYANQPLFQFILLFRIFRISQLVESIEECTSIRDRFAAPLDLSKLIFTVVFVSHICACIWNYIGDYQLDKNDDNWIVRYHMNDANWEQRYIFCFYWSTITTLTVGYGDIVPGNEFERGICSLIVLFCSIVFGYTISSIGAVFKEMQDNKTKYKNNLAQMSSYIKKRNLNKQLQTKVTRFFEYHFKSQNNKNEESELMMELLTPTLKMEVRKGIFLPILKHSAIITETFSEKFLEQLCLCMQTKKCNPGEIVIEQNQIQDKLIFIVSGQVRVQANNNYLRTYSKGFVVGSKQFITQTAVRYTCLASVSSEIASLNYCDFKKLLNEYPQDLQKYQLIRDNLQFNQNYKAIPEVCFICSSNHNFLNCPFTFYQINRHKLLKDNNEQQTRDLLLRKQTKMKQFRSMKREYQMYALAYALENNILKEEEVDHNYEIRLGLAPDYDRQLSSNPERDDVQITNSKLDITQHFSRMDSGRQKQRTPHRQASKIILDVINEERFNKQKSDVTITVSIPDDTKRTYMLDQIRVEYFQYIKPEFCQIDVRRDFEIYFMVYNFQNVLEKFQITSSTRIYNTKYQQYKMNLMSSNRQPGTFLKISQSSSMNQQNQNNTMILPLSISKASSLDKIDESEQ